MLFCFVGWVSTRLIDSTVNLIVEKHVISVETFRAIKAHGKQINDQTTKKDV